MQQKSELSGTDQPARAQTPQPHAATPPSVASTPINTGFGTVLLVIFCPPVYFFVRGKWVAGIIHSMIYVLALLTLIIFGIGVLLWLVGFVHAYWDFAHLKQEQFIQRQASVLAEKMAQKLPGHGGE